MSANHGELKPAVGPNDHVQGRHDAPVTLVEYGDYECPYCGMAYPIVKRVQEALGDKLRFVFRNFPLTEAHPHAAAAAELAEASASQGKFWEMHDVLYEHQDALGPADLGRYIEELALDRAALKTALAGGAPHQRVRADFMSGVRSGVNGTPAFFINGRRFDGDWRDEEIFARALRSPA
ncbi:MAG TPA: thioredoxin domain-containing protein [Steroidobacteraceae bacterium]|jgi:protein-disulfide isomerase|nr:thioredoxin domain-containing protein [Steroidobacteraceae bacterium]